MKRPARCCRPSAALAASLCAASLALACDRAQTREAGPADRGAASPSPKASATASKASATASNGDEPATVPVASRRPAQNQEAEVRPAPGPRVYAKTRYVWIRGVPDSSVQWIGYLWYGGSARLKHERPVYGPGCDHWYAIEPRGYVCVDGKRATLDPNDPEFVRIREYSPLVDRPSPHRYAESLGSPRYRDLPAVEEQRIRERDYTAHLERVAAAKNGTVHPSLAGVDLSPSGRDPFRFESLPSSLRIPRDFLRRESTIAYSTEVDHTGRTFLLTADFTWIPKDRTIPYPEVSFRGVELTGDLELPIAFFKKRDRPRYRREGDGRFVATGESFPRLGHVALTGRSEDTPEGKYLETKIPGVYVAERDAVVPTPQERTPWGATVGEPDTTEHRPSGRQTWIQTSVLGGWLIAYEGTRPVFVTLISGGRGGTPVPGKDPVSTASTPVGRFTITGKFITATMEAPNELIHSDVPWTQNFSGPHALHSAYWHEDFGELKSGGCINVSPIDGKWLFAFTEPELPPDWHAVRWDPKTQPSTTLIVHR